MLTIKIQRGEWIEGYMGRLARWNGKQTRVVLKADLVKWVTSRTPSKTFIHGLMPALAEASKLSLEDVITRHTMWAAFNTVGRPTGNEHFTKRIENRAWYNMLKRARDDDWICPECAVEHIPRSPNSFWYRNHQLPGQMHCQSHGVPLRRVDRQPLLLAQPHEALAYSQEPESSLRECVAGNEHIARATAIQTVLVDERIIASGGSARKVFWARALELGLTQDPKRIGFPELRELVRRQFPIEWLKHCLPLKKGSRIQSLGFVDRAFMASQPMSGIALSVVAAALFDSASSAIDSLRAESLDTNPDVKCVGTC